MKTAHKIAAAKVAYHVVRTSRRLIGRSDRTIVTRNGIRYDLDLSEGIDFNIFLAGQFEPATAAACARHVRPGHTVLDIGANIGAHTMALARLVGSNGRVLAFEPTRYAYEKLTRNLSLNPTLAGRVSAMQYFLGPVDGTDVADAIYSSWPLRGGDDLHDKHRGQAMSTQGGVKRSLDSVLREQGVARVDLVKLDVDGFECEVLAGAERLLTHDRPVFIMELSPYVLEERGVSLERLLQFFVPRGYRFCREHDEAPLPENPAVLAALIGDGASINAIAKPTIHPDRR